MLCQRSMMHCAVICLNLCIVIQVLIATDGYVLCQLCVAVASPGVGVSWPLYVPYDHVQRSFHGWDTPSGAGKRL